MENEKERTTIAISKDTLNVLFQLKTKPSETYDDIINNLIKNGISFDTIKEKCQTVGDVKALTESYKKMVVSNGAKS